jgi:ABC-2 type transport system permease protein
MTFVLMFVPYVSTAFVPARTMPGPLRAFAEHQPLTPVVETMRGIWAGHTSTGASVGHDAWLAVVYCLAILAASLAGSSWLFRHRTTG